MEFGYISKKKSGKYSLYRDFYHFYNDKLKFFGTISTFWILLPLVTNAVPISIQRIESNLEVGNNSILTNNLGIFQPDPGCRYKAVSYLAKEEVPTDEPCLKCQCKKGAVVCKLRICIEPMPNAPPPECVVVQKAKSCCPKLVCPETRKLSREQRLSTGNHKNDSIPAILALNGQGYCVYEGTIYAEGSAMKSNSPCDYCFCIRGKMKCSKPQCVIPLNGCKPRYRSYSCCPTNYDCSESNSTGILQTISFAPSTPIPDFLKGCQVLGRFIYEGEPVLPIDLHPDTNHTNVCQTCFCIGGIIRCRPLECNRPIEDCRPVTEDGHCCPSRYDCRKQENQIKDFEKVYEKNPLTLSFLEDPKNLIAPGLVVNHLNKTTENTLVTNTQNIGEVSTTINYNDSLTLNDIKKVEILSNKFKSDVGSREERRNKVKDDFLFKTSYEDDERDYLFGVPSLETLDHELISKISLDRGLDSPVQIDETESINSRQIKENVYHSNLQIENEDNSSDIMETTIIPESSEIYTEISQTLSPLQNRNITDLGIQISTVQTLLLSETEGIHDSSEFKMNSDTSLLIPDSSSSTTEYPSTESEVTTVSNLHFIVFGVEDAIALPPLSNQTHLSSPNYETFSPLVPMNITYDQKTVKNSLIPQTPQNGYFYSPTRPKFPSQGSSGDSQNVDDELIHQLTNPKEPKDNLRNVIMDVPVSTSLYNNGYYQNGIITKPETNSSFPGQVFDDSGEHHGLFWINETKSEPEISYDSTTQKSFGNFPGTVKSGKLHYPLRTYSKFRIHDSPSYRQKSQNGDTDGHEEQHVVGEFKPSREKMKVEMNPGYSKSKHTPVLPDDYDHLEQIYEDDDQILEGLDKDIENQEVQTEFSKPIIIPAIHKDSRKPIKVVTSTSKTVLNKNDGDREVGLTNFKPVVSFPFKLTQKPMDSFLNVGLKLSGCNIYGKMYSLGNVIRELSGPCVECQCTEMGVQCVEISC